MSTETRLDELEAALKDVIGIMTGIMSTLTPEQVLTIVKFTEMYREELEQAEREAQA